MNFWPPRPAVRKWAVSECARDSFGPEAHTWVDRHDEQHIGGISDLVCNRGGKRVRGDRDAGSHATLVNLVYKCEGVLCVGRSSG